MLTSFRLAQLLNAGGLVLSEGGNARDRSTFARMARFSETVDGMRDEVKAVLAMPPGEGEGGDLWFEDLKKGSVGIWTVVRFLIERERKGKGEG